MADLNTELPAKMRLIELGLTDLAKGAGQISDPRWSDSLNVPTSSSTVVNLRWLASVAAISPESLAARILESSLVRAENTIARTVQGPINSANTVPAFYRKLVAGVRHGCSEESLKEVLGTLQLEDWKEALKELANPEGSYLRVLREFIGFKGDQGMFVGHLMNLAELSPETKSALQDWIKVIKTAANRLDALDTLPPAS